LTGILFGAKAFVGESVTVKTPLAIVASTLSASMSCGGVTLKAEILERPERFRDSEVEQQF